MGIHINYVKLDRLSRYLSKICLSTDRSVDHDMIKQKIIEYGVFFGGNTRFIVKDGVEMLKSYDDIFRETIDIKESINNYLVDLNEDHPLTVLKFKTLLLEHYVDMLRKGGESIGSDFVQKVENHVVHYRRCRVIARKPHVWGE